MAHRQNLDRLTQGYHHHKLLSIHPPQGHVCAPAMPVCSLADKKSPKAHFCHTTRNKGWQRAAKISETRGLLAERWGLCVNNSQPACPLGEIKVGIITSSTAEIPIHYWADHLQTHINALLLSRIWFVRREQRL